MRAPSIAQVVVGLPVEGPFDYLIPEDMASRLAPGQRVLVRFAGKKRVGVVIRILESSNHTGKFSVLIKTLDSTPVFSPALLKLAGIFAGRYACSLGEALEVFLPVYLRGAGIFEGTQRQGAGPSAPSEALVELIFDRGQARRWEILLPRIEKTLAEGRGVLVLLPDATRRADVLPKLAPLVKADERVFLAHDTEKKEYERWKSVRSGQARLVVGFLSSVFAPVQKLGLIVLIEEESSYYKHDQSPFYHARTVAFDRAAIERCDVVCVSSAPSVEIWHRAQQKEVVFTLLEESLPPVKFLIWQILK